MMPCSCPERHCMHPGAQNCREDRGTVRVAGVDYETRAATIPPLLSSGEFEVTVHVSQGGIWDQVAKASHGDIVAGGLVTRVDKPLMSDKDVADAIQDATKRHDAGGSKRWPLQPGVRGSAIFMGENDCYRFMLRRDWFSEEPTLSVPDTCFGNEPPRHPYALFIGMNPSTAEADIDDPTIRAELDFTRALGLESYVKCNVGAYRASFPKDLKLATVELCPAANISTIIAYAHHAVYIIAAWGKVPKSLERDRDAILFRLREVDKPIWCLGKTAEGFPRHPLYVTRSTPLERFR